MDISLTFNNGKFVARKGKLNYQEVIDDFENAKIIRIVTYNISKKRWEDYLLNKLKQVGNIVDIQIVTNIPSRRDEYYDTKAGESMRKSASDNISVYLCKLNPDEFNDNVKPFFNFNNHAKIIGTNNVVYIGSANYSNESAYSYESGVIIRDKKFIDSLYNTFFESLKEDSIPYFEDAFSELRLYIASIFTRLNNHRLLLLDTMFRYSDYNEKWIFISDDNDYTLDDLNSLISTLDEVKTIRTLLSNIDLSNFDIEKKIEIIENSFNDINIDNLYSLCFNHDLYRYFEIDRQGFIDNYLEENYVYREDGDFDDYIIKAIDSFNDKLFSLSCDVEDTINKLRVELKNEHAPVK